MSHAYVLHPCTHAFHPLCPRFQSSAIPWNLCQIIQMRILFFRENWRIISVLKITTPHGKYIVEFCAARLYTGWNRDWDRNLEIMFCIKPFGSFHNTPEPGQGLITIVTDCSGPRPCSCLGPGSHSGVTLLFSMRVVWLASTQHWRWPLV